MQIKCELKIDEKRRHPTAMSKRIVTSPTMERHWSNMTVDSNGGKLRLGPDVVNKAKTLLDFIKARLTGNQRSYIFKFVREAASYTCTVLEPFTGLPPCIAGDDDDDDELRVVLPKLLRDAGLTNIIMTRFETFFDGHEHGWFLMFHVPHGFLKN